MNRRRFFKRLCAAAAAGSFPRFVARWAYGGPRGPERKNVLFLAIDDLNDWVGCLGGHPDAKTPNIDRLASRGVLFERAYCSAPLCNPSRASLLTGLNPSTTGVYRNDHIWRAAPKLKGVVTLPHLFRLNGYYVAGGGKIFHGGQNDPDAWEFYFSKGSYPRPPRLPANGIPGLGNLDWGPVDVPEERIKDTLVAEWAASELRENHKKPFFIGCGIFRPHLPWYVPRKYFELFPPERVHLPEINERDLDDVPPIPRKWAHPEVHRRIMKYGKWREGVAAYLACGAYADACIGRVLAALEESPHKDNTVVVLWCDHGWHLAEKLHWKKFTLWEESTRTPLVFVAPGVTTPGARCPRTVSLLDIYPTLVELCSLPRTRNLEGMSLVRFLKNPLAARSRPALTTFLRGNHSVRTERWRYTRYRDGTEELYDHKNDPLEWTNLAGRKEYGELKGALARFFPKHNEPDAPSLGGRRRRRRKSGRL